MTNGTPAPAERGRLGQLLSVVLKSIVSNWPTKLLALLLAVVLWGGLITQDPTLTREKTFSNVPVTVSGADTLRRNGFIVVSNLTELLGDVDMTVEVPQMHHANATAANYNVRIDLSRITKAGEQDVRIQTTNSGTYGSVQSITPSTVRIVVDEYITRYRIPVSVVTSGEAPEGFYAAEASMDPPMLAISGPRSLVERVARAEAVVDLSTLPARETTIRRAVAFTLLDEENNPIQSDLVQVTSESVLVDSIIVEQQVFTRAEVEVSSLGLVRGTPAPGYEIKGVYLTPSTIIAAGPASVLETMNLLYLNSYVNVEGLSESVYETVYIRQPSRLKYISADEVTVAVEIGPVVGSHAYEDLRLTVRNVGSGLSASVSVTGANVILTGSELWLGGLNARSLTLYCDARGLGEGTYDLPLLCHVENDEGEPFTLEIQPSTVRVTITSAP